MIWYLIFAHFVFLLCDTLFTQASRPVGRPWLPVSRRLITIG